MLQSQGIGTSGVSGFVTNALGGNAFSAATDLIQSIGSGEGGGYSVFYNMGQGVVAGPTQGFGAVFGSSIEGTPFAAGATDIATSAASRLVYATATQDWTAPGVLAGALAGEGAEFATGVGELKLGYDFLTWAGSLAGCAAGVIH